MTRIINTTPCGLFVALLLSLAGCQKRGVGGVDSLEGDTIEMKYATLLTMVRHGERVEVTIRNPWDTTKVLQQFWVDSVCRRAAVYSSVHCCLVEELGGIDQLAGVMDGKYIMHEEVQQRLRDGRMRDFGEGMQPNVEAVIEAGVDLLMSSPMENGGGYGRLERLGIPILECADYMEASPLARAEWMKLYGILFGQEQRADSLFRLVEQRYLALREQAAGVSHKPLVVAEMPYGGHWDVPSGGSTTGILYKDAGARYAFADVEGGGSKSLSVEATFEKAQAADLWMIKYHAPEALTKEALANDVPLTAHIKAYKEDRVYGCNTQYKTYYEDTPFHPDRVLADLIRIIHPELGVKSEYQYFEPVK